MSTPTQQDNASGPPLGQPQRTSGRQSVIPSLTGIAIGLLLVTSLVAWYLQPSPLAVARQYVSEQQGIAPDELALVGHRDFSPLLFGAFMSQMTVEFRVKGAEHSKKRVVDLIRYVYFLPWRVSGLGEGKE
jgi:hypothetical protein